MGDPCPHIRPPVIEGVREARPADHIRALLWMMRGFMHEWKKSGPSVLLALLLFGWLPSLPLTIPIAISRTWARRSRYYTTSNAILGVTAQRNGTEWVLENHSSAHPGSGQGQNLRNLVIPALIGAVDAAGIQITVTTRSQHLARGYARDLGARATVGYGSHGPIVIRRSPA